MQTSLELSPTAAAAAHVFLMSNAVVCEPTEDVAGYYDPETQTWVGQVQIGAGTYSSRSNGSKGGYSHQSDD